MIQINGRPILADEVEILHALRDECAIHGLNYFRVIKPTGRNNVMTTCPFHKEGQERKPSFGVERNTGICHCFTCGWVGYLDEVISLVFGYNDGGSHGRKWLLRSFVSLDIQTRQPLSISLSRNARNAHKRYSGFTEAELQQYRYYHPYMYERGLTDELIEKFDIGYDSSFKLKDGAKPIECITFPVYTHSNDPAFIARRAIKFKLFHYPSDVEKPLYAANMVLQEGCKEVIIVESIFNALTCWKRGRPAVAMLGTGTEYQYKLLKELPVRKYVIGTDPDKAGKQAAERLYQSLKNSKIVSFLDIPQGYDINDLDEKILELQEYF